ncbi:hypothetical protein ACSDIA_002084 [Cronobacter turicensis]|nr:hypothetical protein [Cronobacter turicensis]
MVTTPVYSCCVNVATQNLSLFSGYRADCYLFRTSLFAARGANLERYGFTPLGTRLIAPAQESAAVVIYQEHRGIRAVSARLLSAFDCFDYRRAGRHHPHTDCQSHGLLHQKAKIAVFT